MATVSDFHPRPAAAARPPAGTGIGVAAALLTVTIWAGTLAVSRLGATSGFAVADLAVLRFVVPAVVLLPWLVRGRHALRRAGAARLALIAVGAGLPFFLIATAGAARVPAAGIGVLLTGAMPFFVVAGAAIVFGDRVAPARRVGLALVFAGIVLMAGDALADGDGRTLAGAGLLLAGAAAWAIYTHAYRGSGLDPWTSAAFVSAVSALLLLPPYLVFRGTVLLAMPPSAVLVQVLCQGVLSGIVGLVAFAAAVSRLGAPRASVFGALVPVLVALFGVPLLGEWPAPWKWGAATMVGAGVALAGGIADLGRLPSWTARRRGRRQPAVR